MNKPRIQKIDARCEAVAGDNKAQLFLYGNISQRSWWDDDCISSAGVKEKLDALGEVEEIEVHINSNGGDVFESIAIHNILKQHPAKVCIYIDGLAASGASIIAMAGEDIMMPPTTMMMIHKAWTFAIGNADELRKTAEDMDKMDSAVIEAYKIKFKGEEEDLKALVANETWLTAKECLEFGLCTMLLEETEGQLEEDKIVKTVEEVKNSILDKIRMNASNKVAASINDKQNTNILTRFSKGEI